MPVLPGAAGELRFERIQRSDSDMTVLKKNSVKVYDRFEHETEEQILNGVLKAGDCILSEHEIAAHYRISRRSARTAIDHLIDKGLVVRRAGIGTFVAALKPGTQSRCAKYSASVILPDISDVFLMTVCEGIQQAAHEFNCHLAFKSSHGDIDFENRNILFSLQRQDDGVIIFPNYGRGNLESLLKLKEAGIPFVLLDRRFPDLETNYVGVDNVTGGYLACEHLIRTGCRRIVHLYGTSGSANDERLAGYRRALSDYGIPGSEKSIRRFSDLGPSHTHGSVRFEPDMESGYRNMQYFLSLEEQPDGVFAGNDYQALGALRAIREAGLKIPDQISVVGFDELKINPYLEQPLTTIRQPQAELGYQALKMLIGEISGQSKSVGSSVIRLPVQLVQGKTTRVPGK